MTKILATRPFPDQNMEALAALGDVTARASPLPLSTDEMIDALRNYDVVMATLGDTFSADVFAQAGPPRARLIANFGVGYNHIDVDAARAAGVVVTNTPGAVTDATADIGMTLILMSYRRAGEGERMLRAGNWEGWAPVQLLGQHVTGRTVGIVGMGRIGKAVAKRCHFGFDMDVRFFNRSQVADFGVPAVQVPSLAALAAQVDILVVTVAAGPATHHLIDADVFEAMLSHAHLVNIARGEVVDEAALIAALQAGEIAGAGLDVYEFEPAVPDALRVMENVTLLPHLGTAALEVRTAMGDIAVANIAAVLKGAAAPNAV